jgi:hypothetical protein
MPHFSTALLAASSAALLSVLCAAVAAPEPSGSRPAEVREDFEPELFFAVLEGLYRDGVPNEVVDALLVTNDAGHPALFVPGCPICTPALNAFQVYRARPALVGKKIQWDTFGPGLAPELRVACTLGSLDQRFRALNGLVQGWIERRLDARRLSPEEAEAWRLTMDSWRQKGMAGLAPQQVGGREVALPSCAACDAANGACAVR